VELTVSQRRGGTATVSGFAGTTFICNGREQAWSVTVQPTAGGFKPGRADLVGAAYECPFDCVFHRVEEKVVLHRR
jgi:hypothetical protein